MKNIVKEVGTSYVEMLNASGQDLTGPQRDLLVDTFIAGSAWGQRRMKHRLLAGLFRSKEKPLKVIQDLPIEEDR